jgi:tetratricopeptide (TPR) repeat protein
MKSILNSNSAVYTLLVLIPLLVYSHCIFYGITYYDDELLISKNLEFLSHPSNIVKAFTTDAFYLSKSIDLYRPLQTASFIVDAQWGVDPVLMAHTTNILLHIAACLVIFKLLLAMNFRRSIAIAGSLIYTVHFLFSSAVIWIPARGDLLLSLFTFLAMLTFIRFADTNSWRYSVLHMLFFALALFSKETAVVLPLLFVIYLWAAEKLNRLNKRYLLILGFYGLIFILHLSLRNASVKDSANVTGIIPIIKNLPTIPETVARFFVPVNVSTLPAYQPLSTGTGIVIISALAVFFLFHKNYFSRMTLFGLAWFFILIAPGMTYFPDFYFYCYEHVDHRTYLVCFGLLLVVLGIAQTYQLDKKKSFVTGMVLLLVYLLVVNLHFSKRYKNRLEFAKLTMATNPKSALGFSFYGFEMLAQGKEDEALSYFSQSLKVCPMLPPPLEQRAAIYRKRNLNREALADLNALLATNPDYSADDYTSRALIKIDLHDYDGALEDFTTALRLDPEDIQAKKGSMEIRRTVVNNALLPNVKKALEYNELGVMAGKKGDYRAALAYFRQALSSDPQFYDVEVNIGQCLRELGDLVGACKSWESAVSNGNVLAVSLLKAECSQSTIPAANSLPSK